MYGFTAEGFAKGLSCPHHRSNLPLLEAQLPLLGLYTCLVCPAVQMSPRHLSV